MLSQSAGSHSAAIYQCFNENSSGVWPRDEETDTVTMVKQGFYNFLMTPSESGEKVSQSKVPLVLLPQKACFHAFEGPKNLSGP